MIEKNDCKKWIIGKEEGKNGYKHWQVRLETSNDSFFEWMQNHIPTAHIEKQNAEWMHANTKPRRDNTSCIQTVLKI